MSGTSSPPGMNYRYITVSGWDILRLATLNTAFMAARRWTTNTIRILRSPYIENFPIIRSIITLHQEVTVEAGWASCSSRQTLLKKIILPFKYNRENETSTILKRNEQIFSFFASFFSCSFDRLNIILTPIKSHSKRLKIGVSLCFLSCLLRHSGQTLQLHFRPKVRAFSLHCSRKCERFQGST